LTQPTPPQYRSSSSVAKRPTIFIDVNDPRAKKGKLGIIQSRSGAEIEIVNTSAGMSLSALYSDFGITSGAINGTEDKNAPLTFGQISSTLTQEGYTTGGYLNTIQNPNAPDAVTNLVAAWVGSTLHITFDFDTTAKENGYFKDFIITLTPTGGTAQSIYITTINTSSVHQVYDFTLAANGSLFGFYQTNFSSLSIVSQDAFLNQSLPTTITPPVWSNGLPTPYITKTSITNGYQITTTYLDSNNSPVSPAALPTNPNLNYVDIEEYVDTAGSISVLGLDVTNLPSSLFSNLTFTQVSLSSLNPVTIYTATTDIRYVRAKFTDVMGSGTGTYSNIIQVIPTPVAVVNTKLPTDVSNVSASFSTGTTADGAGNDVLVTATIPTDGNAGNSFIVKLIPTEAPTLSGSFYFYPPSISIPQEFVVNSTDIFAQFGKYYSSYTGYVISVSSVGNKSVTGTEIPRFTRTSTLSSYVPQATLSNVLSGYTVQFNLGQSGASYGEVYQFFSNPVWFTTGDIPDYIDADWVSQGASGSNTITVDNLMLENGGYPMPSGSLPYAGYQITGNGIPPYTWITGINGNGPNYQLTLSNNLTSNASGRYHMQALVYSGTGPANVFLDYYSTVYVVVAYYDDYGDRSENSAVFQATPVNPATSVISNAIQVGSGGSIYVGSSATTGSRIVLGPSGIKGPDGTSAYSGIFAFDYGSTANTAASTAIITNPSAGSYTFETTNAKIADWSINSNQIQNTLGTASNYVGLSATGTYSFWAGSATSGGDANAAFTVTPTGVVTAKKMQLIGDGTSSTNLISAGTFSITNAGVLNATGANISGTINIGGLSTFSGNVAINNGASIYARTFGPSSGQGMVINYNGLSAYDAAGAQTTSISAGASSGSPTFTTSNALIGNWIIGSTTIKSQNKGITLDAANDQIIISGPISGGVDQDTYETIISANGTYVIEAGPKGSTPNFSVAPNGTMTAHNATIDGTISATGSSYSITMDPNNQYLSFASVSGGSSTIQGLVYTSGSAIVMQPGTQKNYTISSSNPGYIGGTMVTGVPYIVLDKANGVVQMGINLDSTKTYNINGVNYNFTPNQFIAFGPQGMHMSSPPYIGNLTDTLAGNANVNYDSFVRTIIQSPYPYMNTSGDSEIATGYAIYYGNGTSPIGSSSGLVGDIWLEY